MAIAAKQLAATYNKDDLKVVDNKIWCFTGDGCLQEGVGQECESDELQLGGSRGCSTGSGLKMSNMLAL
jgi:dihydroxyacetone synthase